LNDDDDDDSLELHQRQHMPYLQWHI